MPRKTSNSGSQRPSTQRIRLENVDEKSWTKCSKCHNRVLRHNFNPHTGKHSRGWTGNSKGRPTGAKNRPRDPPRQPNHSSAEEAPQRKKRGRPPGSRNKEKSLCERCASIQSAQDGHITSTERTTPQSTISDTTGATPSSSTPDSSEDFSTPYSPPKSSPYGNHGGYGSQCQPPLVNPQASIPTPYLPPTFPSHHNQGGHQYPYQQGPVPRQVSKATPYLPSTSSPYHNGHQASPQQEVYRPVFDPNSDPTLRTEFEENYPASKTPGLNDNASYDTDFASDPSTEAQNHVSTSASLAQYDIDTLFNPNRDPTPDTGFEDNYPRRKFQDQATTPFLAWMLRT